MKKETKTISIRIPNELLKDIDIIADSNNVNRTAIIMQFLTQKVDDYKNSRKE